ncbi:Carboxylic ester hydrolase [Mycena kentingensis (nom. inval.)]|nr:Carboxylic ester hydrolase [Mycena kentingensis (nom. inval.)]
MLQLLIFVLPAFAVARNLTSNLGPVVDLGYAAFAGNTTTPTGVLDGPVAFFGNIPFAQPPVGELRWRAPVMLNERTTTQTVSDARNWGPACIQRPAVPGIGSEDCLTLNVWKPTKSFAGAKLPVMVYIHGGGFYANTPQGFPLYDWVAQNPHLVGVSITYRLNMWGFLGGPVVAGDGDLNVGLRDQRAGLEWVQRHISAFGGDPEQVTILGESAGGASVIMQTVAFGGKKPVPFKRVVAQSIGFGPTNTNAQTNSFFEQAASFIGCPTSGPASMPCMRKASVGALIGAVNHIRNGAFAPVIEGPSDPRSTTTDAFLVDLPSRLIHAGAFPNVDFVGGHCTGDGKTFSSGRPEQFVTDDDVKRLVFSRWPGVSNATQDRALALYPAPGTPGSPFATQFDRASAMAGEAIFVCMDWLMSDALTKRGVKNVFAYSWNAPDTVISQTQPYRGAAHTSDLYYLFDGTNTIPNAGNTFTPFNESESLLSREAIAYWTSFGTTGNPNTSKLPTSPPWAPFNSSLTEPEEGRAHLVLTRGADGGTVTASAMGVKGPSQIERCVFWMSEEVTEETRV